MTPSKTLSATTDVGMMPGHQSAGDQELSARLAQALIQEVGQERYELYFAEIRWGFAADVVTLLAEAEFSLSQVRNRFGGLLKEIAHRIWGGGVEVRFQLAAGLRQQSSLFSASELDEIETAPPGPPPSAGANSSTGGAVVGSKVGRVRGRGRQGGEDSARQLEMFSAEELPPVLAAGAGTAKLARRGGQGTGRAQGGWAVATEREASPASPGCRSSMSLATFQFGAANSLAKAATDQVIQRPGQISPLVLFGPVGCGKTHLATGLGQHLRRKFQSFTVLQLSAEQFTTRFLQALNGSGLPSLRSQFRDVELLILEDIQFFQGKKATLIELQHTIDSLLRLGKQLILTTDRHPNDLTFLSPEIQTRLVSGLVIPLQAADREARLAICERWSQQWGLRLASGMSEWLADHISGDARRLSGALFRLLATQSSRGSLIEPAEAMEVLSDYAGVPAQSCSLAMIQKAVCGLCGVDPAELNGAQRTRKISGARMLAMFLARKHTPAALSEIGAFFGGRRHSTVVAAEKRIRNWVQSNESLETASRPLNLREAIRKLESQLKTG
jgi:chromosomal replication initiator protein